MCSKSGEGNMAWAFVRKIELPSPNSIPATHLAVSVASLSLSLSLSLRSNWSYILQLLSWLLFYHHNYRHLPSRNSDSRILLYSSMENRI